MKPSAIFDRWIKDNAERIADDGAEFRKLIAFVALELRMIEHNRNGMSPGTVEAITKRFRQLRTQCASRRIAPPEIELPKIKVVLPRRPR